MKHRQAVSIFALAMLITGAIDSIRNLPATALFGSQLIFFFIFASIVFLIPVALVSADLSANDTDKGGVYHWVRAAFGEKIGFLAIWLQWINTMVWYPTILSFIAGTLAFLINPHLATQRWYLVTVILATFWLMTFINLRGLETSAQYASVCTVIGMIIPMIFIITLGMIWLTSGQPLQLHFSWHKIMPSFGHSESWISLTAIMTAFLGMELASVHVKNIDQPQRKFPRALLISVLIMLSTMILGSLTIAMILPHNKISLIDGVMQAFNNFFVHYHIPWVTPIMAVLLLIGSTGGMVNWMISPAKGLLQASQHHFLPRFFTYENKHGVAQNVLLTQAILVSAMCLSFLLMPSINASYWLLTDLSTQLYMLMYMLLFTAAMVIKLKAKAATDPKRFHIPGGKLGFCLMSVLGAAGCLITLIVGFFPPQAINVGGAQHYEFVFIGGMVLMIVPVGLFYLYKNRNN